MLPSSRCASLERKLGAGNMTADGSCSYTWDAEGRLTSVGGTGCSAASYTYNALGQRVEKLVGSSYTEIVYNLAGQAIGYHDRSSWTDQFFYLGAAPFAKYQGNVTYFIHGNHLGSTTMMFNHTGGTVVQDEIFYPWGERWDYRGAFVDERFASLGRRDAETGNDRTLFRMYESRLYRWLSPDPLAGDISNPESLNRYAYVLNNPTNQTDPAGLWPAWTHAHLTDATFGGVLSPQQVQILINASNWADKFQDPAHAHMHGMCTPWETPTGCRVSINAQVYLDLSFAEQSGPSNDGLWYMGLALHLLEDMTSPAHADLNGNPYVWYETWTQFNDSGLLVHSVHDAAASLADFYDQGLAIWNMTAAWTLLFGVPSGYSSQSAWASSSIANLYSTAIGFMNLSPLAEGQAWGCINGNPAACVGGFDDGFTVDFPTRTRH